MPPALDLDQLLFHEYGRAIVERASALGKRAEHIQLGECRRRALQSWNVWRKGFEQPLVQQLLAGERALLRGERLVFEGFELRRDVALCVLERLPAAVIVRNLVGV